MNNNNKYNCTGRSAAKYVQRPIYPLQSLLLLGTYGLLFLPVLFTSDASALFLLWFSILPAFMLWISCLTQPLDVRMLLHLRHVGFPTRKFDILTRLLRSETRIEKCQTDNQIPSIHSSPLSSSGRLCWTSLQIAIKVHLPKLKTWMNKNRQMSFDISFSILVKNTRSF